MGTSENEFDTPDLNLSILNIASKLVLLFFLKKTQYLFYIILTKIFGRTIECHKVLLNSQVLLILEFLETFFEVCT